MNVLHNVKPIHIVTIVSVKEDKVEAHIVLNVKVHTACCAQRRLPQQHTALYVLVNLYVLWVDSCICQVWVTNTVVFQYVERKGGKKINNCSAFSRLNDSSLQ